MQVYQVGIILPLGFTGLRILKNPKEKQVTTVYGDVSVIECEVGEIPCSYILRAGKPANPSMLNYRANIWALKETHCTHIIAVNIGGTISDDIRIGTIAIISDFYDHTTGREKCFHDGEFGSPKGAVIVPMIPPFNPHIRQCVINAASRSNVDILTEGKAVVTDGAAFPTRMELMVYKSYNADIIHASICPEASLAKEAGMLYVDISIITFNANVKALWPKIQNAALEKKDTIEELLKASIAVIGKEKWEKDFCELRRDIAPDIDRSCKCRK